MRTAVTTWWIARAFTLVEMLVVLTMIGILTAIVLPSMVGLFTAGADAQAYNALAGQLAAARSLAIQQRTHAGVHAQLADTSGKYTKGLVNTCFTAVVWEVLKVPNDPNQGTHFVLAEGFSPQKLPGAMAFGRVDDPFFSGGQYSSAQISTDAFTSLTLVFAPNGQLVEQDVTFPHDDSAHPAFDATHRDTRMYLWDPGVADGQSVKAAVMFDYSKFAALPENDRRDYLTKFAQLIAINLYTGTPLGR